LGNEQLINPLIYKKNSIMENLHGYIPLSNIEKEIISSTIFNRLHNIYQNSNVYLTFPSLRIKRFEHSVGTMHLAGKYFRSAVSNTNDALIEEFLQKVMKKMENDYTKEGKFETYSNIKKFLTTIGTFEHNIDKFYPESIPKDMICYNQESSIKYYRGLVLLLYQATRIVGLLHDIGHPPFSHISEHAYVELYREELINQFRKKTEDLNSDENRKLNKVIGDKLYSNIVSTHKNFYNSIEDSNIIDNIEDILINSIDDYDKDFFSVIKKYSHMNKQIHEHLGIILAEKLKDGLIKKKNDYDDKLDYKILFKKVCFMLAIDIFKSTKRDIDNHDTSIYDSIYYSLHTIVDSYLDVDRMDFIPREQVNSGLFHYNIDYNKIFSNISLSKIKHKIVSFDTDKKVPIIKESYIYSFCPNDKIIGEIEDFLLRRYSSYSQMNYHHRSIKMAKLLKECIKLLIKEAIKSKEETNYSLIWKYLNKNKIDDKFFIWDDNYMWSTIQKEYIKISYNIKKQHYSLFSELVTNKKYYHSLIKRYTEYKIILDGIISESKDELDYKFVIDILDFNDRNNSFIFKEEIEKIVKKALKDNNSNIKDVLIEFPSIKSGIDKDFKILSSLEKDKTYNFHEISDVALYLRNQIKKFPKFFVFYYSDEKITENNKITILKKIGKEIFKVIKNRIKQTNTLYK